MDCFHCSSRDTLQKHDTFFRDEYEVTAYNCTCCAKVTFVQRRMTGLGAEFVLLDKKIAGRGTSTTG